MQTNTIANQTNFDFIDSEQHLQAIPRPVVALAREYPHGHRTPFHAHSRSQLVYASEGLMTVRTANGIWVVPPLRAVWVPAFTDHQTSAQAGLSMRTLYIRPDAAGGLPARCCVVSVPPLMRELILHAVTLPRLYHRNSPAERIMNVILDQIKTLRTRPLDLPIPGGVRTKKIFEALSRNPSDNRTLEEWGKQVGATGRTLARQFRSETGIGFRQLRQQIRILAAMQRLGRDETVTTVAMDLGYDSPSAFISMFKKALGSTPGQFFRK